MAKVKATRVGAEAWGRTPIPLIGIDWLLRRKAAAIVEATRLVKLEPGLEARKEIIRTVQGEYRKACSWMCFYYAIGFSILNLCRLIAQDYTIPFLAFFCECAVLVLLAVPLEGRLRLIEAAQIDLWAAGGAASLSSLIVDLPTSVKKESRNVGLQRLDLIISLLTDSKALSQLSAAERNKLLKYCDAADNMHKYRWRWQFRAIRLREILQESAKAPVKSRNA